MKFSIEMLILLTCSGSISVSVTPEFLNVKGVDPSSSTMTPEERNGKFFSIFSIVRFENTACTTTAGLNGTCITSNECSNYGGSAYGSCASGFGVCCVVTISTCGSSTQYNGTYWTNPGYSSTYSTEGQCSLYVSNCSSNICQLRLDFIAFNIAQPDSTALATAGRCLTDSFTVTGQSNTVPAICGINANQHIYIHRKPGQNVITLTMSLTGTATDRSWNIRISQIPCGANYAAPNHCLQYFMDTIGSVASFNYLYSDILPIQHLANQDYTVCVRTNSGFCGIEWNVCTLSDGTESPWSLSSGTISLSSFACVTDFLMFPCITDQMNSIYLSSGAFVSGAVCAGKLCGIPFNPLGLTTTTKPGYSYTTPFMFRFHSNSGEDSPIEGYGFCFAFTQLPCTTTSTGSG